MTARGTDVVHQRLASWALRVGSVEEFLPNLDPSSFDAVAVLACYLAEHPNEWHQRENSEQWLWLTDDPDEVLAELHAAAIDAGASS